jgi:GntR family transcriptional repressor for pyruvate dehydrogenase complex
MKKESMSEKITDLKRMALFREVKSKKLSDEVFEQIKALIFKGDLKPGDRLPPERELAQFLNVGRSSLREALIRLSAVGLIEARKTDGYFVRSVTEEMVGSLQAFIEDEIKNLVDFMEVRKVLEIWCANEAIKKGSDDDFDKIREALEQGDNKRFHVAIVEATHNVILYHVMCNMHDLLSTIAFIKQRRRDHAEMSVRHHRKIYEALINRDQKSVEEAIKEHMDFFIEAAKETRTSP